MIAMLLYKFLSSNSEAYIELKNLITLSDVVMPGNNQT